MNSDVDMTLKHIRSDADTMQTWTRLGMEMLTKLTNPQGNENLQIFVHVAKETVGSLPSPMAQE